MSLLAEPYDTIFVLKDLISNCEITSILDNEDMHNFCRDRVNIHEPKWIDLNDIMGQILSSESLSFRFPTDVCSDSRKFAGNLVPYKNLHFLSHALCQLCLRTACFYYHKTQSTERLTINLFSNTYHLLPDSQLWFNFKRSNTYFGRVDTSGAEIELSKIKAEKKDYFIEQISDNLKYWICPAQSRMTRSGHFAYNSAQMRNKFNKAIDKFDELLKRKTFMCRYLAEGMEESEFQEAKEDVMQLISEYQQLLNNSNLKEYLCVFNI